MYPIQVDTKTFASFQLGPQTQESCLNITVFEMASGNDAITRMLDPTYLASRDIEQVRKTWNPILHQEMGRHWDMIKEGMKGFAFAHTEMVKVLAKYERDETAELVLHDFLDRMFPGALELLTQIGPYINQYPSCVTDEVILIIDDSDSRSVTMGPEPGSSRRPEPTTSMGPPPRPIGLLTPETPSRHRYGESSGDSGLSTIYDVPDSPPPDAAHGPLTLQQTAKRSLDTLDIEPAQSPGSPSKRAKKATGLQSVAPAKVTRTIDLWEVEGTDYIFKDKRCGHGWYVIRCNLGQQPGVNAPGKFVKNPLEGNTALNHFNDQSHTCHDTNRKWTIEDIIRECAHRGKQRPT